MDWRLVEPLLSRFSPVEFQEAHRRAVRRAIAVLRSGAPAQDFERARAFASMVRFFGRLAVAAARAGLHGLATAFRATRRSLRRALAEWRCLLRALAVAAAASVRSRAPLSPPAALRDLIAAKREPRANELPVQSTDLTGFPA